MSISGKFKHDRMRDMCKQYGGKLSEPKNEGENNFLASLNTDKFVLGMNDKKVEGQWVWDSDGSKVTWFNWAKYGWMPNGGRSDNCAYMVRDFNNLLPLHQRKDWADMKCSSILAYDLSDKSLVCERSAPKGKHITKDIVDREERTER